MTTEIALRVSPDLPPVLAGSMTPEVRGRVGDFYLSIASIFDAWVGRRKSAHTQRAYRGDVMAFVAFMGWRWPDDATNMLRASILEDGGSLTELVRVAERIRCLALHQRYNQWCSQREDKRPVFE